MKNKTILIVFAILLFFVFLAFPEKKHQYYNLDSYVSIEESLTLDQAIDYALNNNPDIHMQMAALLNASSQLHRAKGQFDFKFGGESAYNRTLTPTDAKNRSVISGDDILYQTVEGQDFTTKLYLEKLFALGINTKLNYQLSRGKQKYMHGLYAQDPYYAAYSAPDYNNTGSWTFEVSIPLLKSFNLAIADNNLKLAKENYTAMAYNLEDTISKVIMQTVETYWKYYTAYERVLEMEKVVQKNEQRVQTVDRLVRTGIKTKNEQLRIKVNALTMQRQLDNSRIEFFTAKTNLATQIGIPIEAVANPEFTFPEVLINGEIPNIEDYDRAELERIISNRPDIISLVNSCNAAETKLKVAKVNALPDLNLSLSIGTNGAKYGWYAEDYFSATTSNIRGLNYGGKLTFSLPIASNEKKADIEQAQAAYQEALAKLNKQKNIFILQLQNSISALNIYNDTVKNAKEILDSQEQVYLNEQKRYDAGLSSIDILLQQDTAWLDSMVSYYQVYETYLKYVLEYKYYTLGFVSIDLNSETLYSLNFDTEENNDENTDVNTEIDSTEENSNDE